MLPRLGLYRPVTVLSGSMRPTFSPGDMVIVAPEPVSAVRVGQVISYQVPVGIHQVETHRVVKILQGGAHPVIQTQGDANNWPDPWTAKLEGNTAWRMRRRGPASRLRGQLLRGRTLQQAAIIVAPALLALLMLSEIWGIGDAESQLAGGAASRAGRREPLIRTSAAELEEPASLTAMGLDRYSALAILVLVVSAMLASAQVALAVFNHTAAGGPLTVATSTLAAPAKVTATQVNCRTNKTPEIEVTWSATTLHATRPPTRSNARQPAAAHTRRWAAWRSAKRPTSTRAARWRYSTTYYYRVGAVYHSWSSDLGEQRRSRRSANSVRSCTRGGAGS